VRQGTLPYPSFSFRGRSPLPPYDTPGPDWIAGHPVRRRERIFLRVTRDRLNYTLC